MNLTGISTAALARELLRRAEHTDALLALVNGAGKLAPPPTEQEKPATSNGHAPRKPKHVKHEEVIAVLRDAGRPLTCVEINRRIPRLTSAATHRHMDRGIKQGTIVQHGNSKPHAYGLSTQKAVSA